MQAVIPLYHQEKTKDEILTIKADDVGEEPVQPKDAKPGGSAVEVGHQMMFQGRCKERKGSDKKEKASGVCPQIL